MKTIGLIGGTTWHSTVDYYRIINETINRRIGHNASAKILLYSVNYGEIVALTEKQDWDGIAEIICPIAKKLEAAGADCLLLCANTMHLIAEKVKGVISIPLIHIADDHQGNTGKKSLPGAFIRNKIHHVSRLLC